MGQLNHHLAIPIRKFLSVKLVRIYRRLLLIVAFGVASMSILHNPTNRVLVSPSGTTTRHDAAKKIFVPFHGNIENHQSTVEGQRIPGLFRVAEEGTNVYLTGVRMTTFYNNDNIHLNVFALPGFKKDDWCTNNTHYLDENAIQGVFLYALPMVEESGGQNSLMSSLSTQCSRPFFVDVVPVHTVDGSVNRASFIWSSNITECVNRQHLREAIAASSIQSEVLAFRVKLWITRRQISMNNTSLALSILETMQPSLTVDIPLLTSVVGAGGPQIRNRVAPTESAPGKNNENSATSIMAHANTPPVAATLCAGIYGPKSVKQIPYFVQHHVNVGFEHIVIAVLFDRSILLEVQKVLSTFIEQGIVMLSFIDLPDTTCGSDPHKVVFYQSCVYHSKGVSEYVAIWDVDEFWVPPKDFPVHSLGTLEELGKSAVQVQSKQEWHQNHSSILYQSHYRTTFPIGLVMHALAAYHNHHGCSQLDWCTHSFPSFTVYSHRDHLGRILPPENRTMDTLFGANFTRRDSKTNLVWKKGIGRTALVHAGGFHEFGSCLLQHYVGFQNPQFRQGPFDGNRRFHLYEDGSEKCKDLILEDFGTMHHFMDMSILRTDYLRENEYLNSPMDEYSFFYAKTVRDQLSSFLNQPL